MKSPSVGCIRYCRSRVTRRTIVVLLLERLQPLGEQVLEHALLEPLRAVPALVALAPAGRRPSGRGVCGSCRWSPTRMVRLPCSSAIIRSRGRLAPPRRRSPTRRSATRPRRRPWRPHLPPTLCCTVAAKARLKSRTLSAQPCGLFSSSCRNSLSAAVRPSRAVVPRSRIAARVSSMRSTTTSRAFSTRNSGAGVSRTSRSPFRVLSSAQEGWRSPPWSSARA